MIYLDHNATTPLRPEARAALLAACDDAVGNPSAVHAAGRAARGRLESARAEVAAFAGAAPAGVIFTSGATEANAQAVADGLARHGRVLASAVEHPSILAQPGVIPLPVTTDGRLDLAALERALADGPALLCLMAVNNETGVIQPVVEAAGLCRAAGAALHCDAVQAAGRVPLAPVLAVADSLSLSAHKLGGPPGVGALILADPRRPIAPLIQGGGQELRRRGGTENLPGILAFAAASRAAGGDLARQEVIAALRDRLEAEALAAAPGALVAGAGALRVANTSCLVRPGLPADLQVMRFDLAGIAVSAGSACSSGKVAVSPVLQAMGLGAAAGCGIRISLGPGTTATAIDRFLEVWRRFEAGPGHAASSAA